MRWEPKSKLPSTEHSLLLHFKFRLQKLFSMESHAWPQHAMLDPEYSGPMMVSGPILIPSHLSWQRGNTTSAIRSQPMSFECWPKNLEPEPPKSQRNSEEMRTQVLDVIDLVNKSDPANAIFLFNKVTGKTASKHQSIWPLYRAADTYIQSGYIYASQFG